MRSVPNWLATALAVLAIGVLSFALPAHADEFNANTGGASPCDQTYADAEHAIVEARMLNDARYKKAKIDCNGESGCIRAAERQLVAGQRDIAKRQVDASAQHDLCRAAPGAVMRGDPDAADAGVPGFLGSFPGTKSSWGSFCYTYLCERNVWTANPTPTQNPRAVGHDAPQPGDAALVYQPIGKTGWYLPLHFAVYQGNGIFYQRNGASSVEVVNAQFFHNFSNAVVRYVDPKTGK